jgi:hypothetical protein
MARQHIMEGTHGRATPLISWPGSKDSEKQTGLHNLNDLKTSH